MEDTDSTVQVAEAEEWAEDAWAADSELVREATASVPSVGTLHLMSGGNRVFSRFAQDAGAE